jgi:hypothetical protein
MEAGTMKTLRIFGMGLSAAMLMAGMVKADDYTYETNADNTIAIIKYTGSGGAVSIPNEINGKSVSYIEECAFYLCTNLTSVTIPDGVKGIDMCTFNGCTGLTNVTIPNGVTGEPKPGSMEVRVFAVRPDVHWIVGDPMTIRLPVPVVRIDPAYIRVVSPRRIHRSQHDVIVNDVHPFAPSTCQLRHFDYVICTARHAEEPVILLLRVINELHPV